MIHKGQMEGILRRVPIKGMHDPVSHVQFADDVLIFSKAKSETVANLRTAIRCFEAVAGLKVNLAKSKIYGINLDSQEISDIADFMGCSPGSFPTYFLGLPLCIGVPKSHLWEKIIQRFHKHLSGWKSCFLSIGGRLTLINATLSNLPTYFMSLFRCPSKVLKVIDTLRRNFLWQGKEDKKKYNLIQWRHACQQIKDGGAGIKDLKLMN
ncbi:uncharacterized protein LOC131238961 [Magnolia sinica]|uniref:uncharacterized protein LOC131238961 n=1 Tax=Magnolia sinica TaxID=86752 RepID=UPI002659263B|nr:uncharacterized protein LOC131238961 [Magnolia sinica]